MIEVSDAVISQGVDRKGANELLAKLAKTFERKKPQEGYEITECYDLVHHQPRAEYEGIYARVKKQISEMGLLLP
jgi:hypothetical protein